MSEKATDITTLPAAQENRGRTALSMDDVKTQVSMLQEFVKSVMVHGKDYDTIPGTNKPTLLKPGAEKINAMFGFVPKYTITNTDLGNNHREISIITSLYTRDGVFIGEGLGSCSTMESKFRWRKSGRVCPKCGKDSIIAGKPEYGGGWICFTKKGGCGAKFATDDATITSQSSGRLENPDIADTWNTVLKMAKKRSYVDATINSSSSSDLFTQDVEDFKEDTDTYTETYEQKPADNADKKKELADALKKELHELCDALHMDKEGVFAEYGTPQNIEEAKKLNATLRKLVQG